METEVRFRLSATEEKLREVHAVSVALRAIIATLPQLKAADKAAIFASIGTIASGQPDAPALEIRARQYVNELFGGLPRG
jgi:hypothetical protein